MGISLFDSVSDDKKKCALKVYDKIMKSAGDLVKVAEEIASEFVISIVNKRVSVTPVSMISAASGGHLEVAAALDRAAKEIGIDFIGGYTALVSKGMTPYEETFIKSIPEAISTTDKLCSSVNVATTRAGINMNAIRLIGKIVKETALKTSDKGGIGCAKFVVFANSVEDNPFMAGAFNGVGEGDKVITESANEITESASLQNRTEQNRTLKRCFAPCSRRYACSRHLIANL
jgi:uncharacterized protein (UPF0210 family)